MDDFESEALTATLQYLDEVSAELWDEEVYGFTFNFAAEENYLVAAFGTEERLRKTAQEYLASGYTVTSGDAHATLAEWLRWSSPDDGWLTSVNSAAFIPFNRRLLERLKDGTLELYGGHLVKLTRRILLDDTFDHHLMRLTRGRRIPKLRACMAFLVPEVVPWAEETNPPDVFEAFRLQNERWDGVNARIIAPTRFR